MPENVHIAIIVIVIMIARDGAEELAPPTQNYP